MKSWLLSTYDVIRDLWQGGTLHQSRRLVSRLRKVVRDMRESAERIKLIPGTAHLVEAISRHRLLATDMLDQAEHDLQIQETFWSASRSFRRLNDEAREALYEATVRAMDEKTDAFVREAEELRDSDQDTIH